MTKKPRFFCDNCGKEVEQDAKACSNCGRFFASVRCPSCGFSGEEAIFANGCPSCGYSAPPSAAAKAPQIKAPAKPLPLWVYVFAVAAFIAAIAVLVFVLTH